MSSEIKVDTISEKTAANGVTIDGVNLKDSVVKTDTISEKTSAAGVTIDSVLLKDGVSHSGLVKLASGTASGSSELLFDNFVDTSTYASYIGFVKYVVPTDNQKVLRFTFRQGGGSGSDLTGNYRQSAAYAFLDTSASAVAPNLSRTDYSELAPGLGNTAQDALSMNFEFYPADGTNGINQLLSRYVVREYNDETASYYTSNHSLEVSTATTGLRFHMSSGNIASGSIYIYGVKL